METTVWEIAATFTVCLQLRVVEHVRLYAQWGAVSVHVIVCFESRDELELFTVSMLLRTSVSC